MARTCLGILFACLGFGIDRWRSDFAIIRGMVDESKIRNMLALGENVGIEFKRAGDGPKSDTYETMFAVTRQPTRSSTRAMSSL